MFKQKTRDGASFPRQKRPLFLNSSTIASRERNHHNPKKGFFHVPLGRSKSLVCSSSHSPTFRYTAISISPPFSTHLRPSSIFSNPWASKSTSTPLRPVFSPDFKVGSSKKLHGVSEALPSHTGERDEPAASIRVLRAKFVALGRLLVRFVRRRRCSEEPLVDRNMFDVSGRSGGGDEETKAFWSQEGRMGQPVVGKQTGWSLDQMDSNAAQSRLSKEGACPRCGSGQNRQPTDVEQMKEMFAKLLLGEDMSGGGKGVSSALALSNAITNHAASVFGEQVRLEPMSAERKARWRREIDWLLSVTDYIVELVPSQQVGSDGTKMEIMTTQQRKDLLVNIPALRKLDAMLIGYLDNFKDKNEFWYVNKDAEETEKGNAERKDDKWWLPTVKVPPNGLSDVSRKWLQFQKESVNQVLKAAMAINAQVLMEMEIPEAYIDSLPKNGRASLGELLYRNITVEYFDPSQFLESVDLSTEHRVVDLKNRIEASVVIWNRKMHNKDVKAWGPGVSLEKREQFEERAQTILHLLKHRFPGIPQSALDISKIQFNKDVGLSILESYSRILESLAHTVMSKIEDVLYADWLARDPGERRSMEEPNMTRLSDFMGWGFEQESEDGKEADGREDMLVLEEARVKKPPGVLTHRVPSYTEKLECLGGMRSPTSRH